MELAKSYIWDKLEYMKNVFPGLLLFIVLPAWSQADSALKMGTDSFEKGISKNGIQVLDVRTSGEYNSGHIKNALLADWTIKEQFNERIEYVDKDRPVYIYCLAGGRSAAAADWMRKNGFTSVIELAGGMNAWKAAGKPMEGISNEPQMTIDQYWSGIPKNKTTLVDFGAPWCPPCVKMAPVLDELTRAKDLDFSLVKVDAGIHTDIMKTLGIGPIPVFIVYKNGKEVWRKAGVVSKEELENQLRH
jgi:rhodanese-related sulfurtransferase